MPRFKDAPLGKDQFRLFKFKHKTGEIELEVKTFKIYRAPKYKAVSYCWGDKSDGVEIVKCNNEPLEVWTNLHAALRRLWPENGHAETWYWNDAICIEQGDDESAITEKKRQIAFMETIFVLADPVIVWLGDASTEEERVFQYLADTCAKLAQRGAHIDEPGLPGPKDEAWRYWSQTLLRPWFTRLWIVQESLLSAGKVIVTLGKQAQTTWANFREMVNRTGAVPWTDEAFEYDKLDDRAKLTVDRDFLLEWGIELDDYENRNRGRKRDDALQSCVYRNVVNIRELLHFETYHDVEYGFLEQALKVYGNRKCAYDQDRPNAMRGVLTDRLKKGLKVYDINADVATVYREVTRVWLTNDPTLSLLQRIRPLTKFLPRGHHNSGTKLKNPSWAIDLGRVVTEALGAGLPNRSDGFHAGMVKASNVRAKSEWIIPETKALFRLRGTKHVLFPDDTQCHISGVQIGTVDSVVSSYTEAMGQEFIRSGTASKHDTHMAQWIDDCFELIHRTVVDHDSAKEVHWRTLILNVTDVKEAEVKRNFDVDDRYSRLQAYEQGVAIIKSGRSQLLLQADDAIRRYWWTAFRDQYPFPNWFSVSTGLIGRSYAVPQAGDVVAVFYGAATPFLLRPVPGHETYEYMGEAYVHGVMQGEALLEKNKDRYLRRIFKLI